MNKPHISIAMPKADGIYNVIFTDVDECQTNNGECNQTCTNTPGSFECSCGIGYNLAANNLDCEGKV